MKNEKANHDAGSETLTEGAKALPLRALVDYAAVGLACADLTTGAFMLVNRKFCEILGYEEDELMKLTFKDLTHPEDWPACWENCLLVFDGTIEQYSLDKRYLCKNGEYRWVRVSVSVCERDANGKALIGLGVVEDISERVRSERDLAFLTALRLDLIAEGEPEQMTWDSLGKVADYLEFEKVYWGTFEPDGVTVTIKHEFPKDGCSEEIFRAGNWVIGEEFAISNIETDPQAQPFLAQLREMNVVSCIGQPFFSVDGPKVILVGTCSRPREWKQGEIKMLREAVARIYGLGERAKSSKDLRDSEERFRATFENAAVGIAHLSMDGKLLRVNSKLCEIMGYTREELISKRVEDLSYPEDGVNWEMAGKVFSGEIPSYSREKRYFRKSGEVFWVSSTLSASRMGEKGLFLIAILQDISQRKQAEAELAASRERFEGIVESAMDAVVTVDEEQKVVLFNAAAEHMFQVSEKEAIGESLSRFMPARFHAAHTQHVKHFGEQNKTSRAMGYLGAPLMGLRADGEEFPIEASISKTKVGDKMLFTAILRDVTERVLAEEQRQYFNEQLERRVEERTAELAAANREMEAFSYSVSHDLRAPLRALDGFSDILIEDYSGSLGEQGRDYLRRVRAASQRMGQLIDAMLQLSRLARKEMRLETVNLSELAWSIVGELQLDSSRQVEWKIQDAMTARGDTQLLRILLTNLLGNAWKYTGKREVSQIEFGEEEGKSPAVWFVRDNGVGFNMESAGRLFTPFQRMYNARDFEGVGIGLATVFRIVDRHGGQIWADAKLNSGATFFFTLAGGSEGGK